MPESLPAALGRYELVEKLAVGGMAELFRARVRAAHGFEKPLVIKRILPHLAKDEHFTLMFITEAKLTAQLVHPKIAQTYELGTEDNQLFIANLRSGTRAFKWLVGAIGVGNLAAWVFLVARTSGS